MTTKLKEQIAQGGEKAPAKTQKGWFTLTKITTSQIYGEIPLTAYDANVLLARAESKGSSRFTVEQNGVQVAAFPKEVRQ